MNLKRISPEEAKELLDSDEEYVYLDVRSIPEFEAGHAPGARNIPLLHRTPVGMQPNGDFVNVCEKALGKDAKIITACLKGGRSMKAAQILMANGFSNVVDMRGGFMGEPDPHGRHRLPGVAAPRPARHDGSSARRHLRGAAASGRAAALRMTACVRRSFVTAPPACGFPTRRKSSHSSRAAASWTR